jgi:hypothetical protein
MSLFLHTSTMMLVAVLLTARDLATLISATCTVNQNVDNLVNNCVDYLNSQYFDFIVNFAFFVWCPLDEMF